MTAVRCAAGGSCLGVIVFTTVVLLAGAAPAGEKYLLLDSRVVGQVANARLTVGTIAKHPANPLFKEDQDWEVRFDNLYANVLYDVEEKLYKCWYSPFIRDRAEKPPKDRWDEVRYRPSEREMGVCYAISKDGLRWEKPELSLVEFDGSTKNNLVLRGPHGAGVFKDPREQDPRRRYKMFYKGPGMCVRFSADGLRWGDEIRCDEIAARGDTHNNAFRTEQGERYVGITRLFEGQRLVGRTESADFENWTPAVEILRGDVENQTYAMPVFRHADVYLGLVMVFRRGMDRVHCELAWSPDSVTWHRIDVGTPLIPLSETHGEYDWGCAYAAACPIVMPDGKIRLYYGASNGRHTAWRDGFLALATLRPDGWAGYEPSDETRSARVRSVALNWSGESLLLSADARGGDVEVALLDSAGNVLAQSELLTGDVTAAVVRWQNGSVLSELRGKPVHLEFRIRNARLFSFEFAAD